MPRSKDPRNYGNMYRDLALLMDSGEQEITLNVSGRNAIYIRNNFYAYINAWKQQAEHTHKHKGLVESVKIEMVEEALRMEDTLRRYLVVIDPRADPELESVTLRFIDRNIDPRTADAATQLSKLVEQTGAVDKIVHTQEQIHKIRFPHQTPTAKPSNIRTNPITKHFFEGELPEADPNMSEQEADDILKGVLPDPTDIADLIPGTAQSQSDLITKDNKPTKPTSSEILRLANASREAEKKAGKETEK